VKGKVVMITGSGQGIGKAAALKIAAAGATVLVVDREAERLAETKKEIEDAGGRAVTYQCDLTEFEQVDKMVEQVLAEHGAVDVLVNNAGRSIRRSIEHSFDRFHDFERVMKLNYFGALRVTLGLLPAMQKNKQGHVIDISSIGVLTHAPRFAAYVASKAAMDAFARCAASEFADDGIAFTTINMPLVRTAMTAPTRIYQQTPMLAPEEAADFVVKAIIERPERIATRLGVFAEIVHAVAPKIGHIIMNTAYRMFPESAAALGKPDAEVRPTAEQIAFVELTRGFHF
jgi:NAD(P)-dependent dehydrogenase (short-subunit alcohol dehydrogenase family)